MWLKPVTSVPKYSEFAQKGTVKTSQQIQGQFTDIPNYKMTSKAFDVQHLDKFLQRMSSLDQPVNDQVYDDGQES